MNFSSLITEKLHIPYLKGRLKNLIGILCNLLTWNPRDPDTTWHTHHYLDKTYISKILQRCSFASTIALTLLRRRDQPDCFSSRPQCWN